MPDSGVFQPSLDAAGSCVSWLHPVTCQLFESQWRQGVTCDVRALPFPEFRPLAAGVAAAASAAAGATLPVDALGPLPLPLPPPLGFACNMIGYNKRLHVAAVSKPAVAELYQTHSCPVLLDMVGPITV